MPAIAIEDRNVKELRKDIKEFYTIGFNRFRTCPKRLDKKNKAELVDILMNDIGGLFVGSGSDVEDNMERCCMSYNEIYKFLINDYYTIKSVFGIDLEKDGETFANVRYFYEKDEKVSDDYHTLIILFRSLKGIYKVKRSFNPDAGMGRWFSVVKEREPKGEMWKDSDETPPPISRADTERSAILPPITLDVKPVLANVCVFNDGSIRIMNIEDYEMSFKNGQLILTPKLVK
jgi:hypothetical protein